MPHLPLRQLCILTVSGICLLLMTSDSSADRLRQMQQEAIESNRAAWGHWGPQPAEYSSWKSHTNRLIPVYTFGMRLESVCGEHDPYRTQEGVRKLYGPQADVAACPHAEYFDQTQVYALQQQAISQGKRRIILMVFDGLDWQTTQAAAIYQSGQVYQEGKGRGLSWLDYDRTVSDYGYCVTSPWCEGTKINVNQQTVTAEGEQHGGYDWRLGGETPWAAVQDPLYLIGRSPRRADAYTDSSSSATSMTAGIKTYNGAVNIDHEGRQVRTIAHDLQDRGWAIGVVSSVPVSHATPAAAYAHNVSRDDFQDLTRDLLGLPSVAHPKEPLRGVDVLLGCGHGVNASVDPDQGENFQPGNRYLPQEDMKKIDVTRGGAYRMVQRTSGSSGSQVLAQAASQAAGAGERLLGVFGVPDGGGHLPYRTADGGYNPTRGVRPAEQYTPQDIEENPTLAEMTTAALQVLSTNEQGFWLMIEAGDVDWANHDNNIDNSIGAVVSGDQAFQAATRWIENHGGWDDTALILTADHGHYLVLTQPEALIAPNSKSQASAGEKLQGTR